MKTKSLGNTLFRNVFGLYFLVAFILTALQVFYAFFHEKDRAIHEGQELVATLRSSIVLAFENYDISELDKIVGIIEKKPFIKSARILEVRGGKEKVLTSKKEKINLNENGYLYQYDFEYQDIGGRVDIIVDSNYVMGQFSYDLIWTVVTALIKTLALWGIFLFLIRKYVSSPLQEIKKRMLDPSFDQVGYGKIMELYDQMDEKYGELKNLVKAFSDMHLMIESKNQVLENLADRLRTKVEEQTFDLRTKMHELKEQTQLAQKSEKLKTEFLSTMSHEIRTPLNGIIGLSSYILDQSEDPKLNSEIQLIQESAEHLLAIINDILDLAKLEAGQIKLENISFSLSEVSSFVISHFKHHQLVLDRGLQLRCNLEHNKVDLLLGDPSRIKQILMNLINNAVKFTAEGEVQLLVYSKKIGQDVEVNFEVQDTGEGIDPETINQLFQKFQQADSSISRKHGGTGLGLSICKDIVEVMEGDIRVESELGKGSTFYIQLHLKESGEERSHFEKFETKELSFSGKHILVAEDNKVNQILMDKFLKRFQVNWTLAKDGEEACQYVCKEEGHPFDLILMDVMMPTLDGIQATSRIREFEKTRKRYTKIVALTANVKEGREDEYLEKGMDGALWKPININALGGLLKRFL